MRLKDELMQERVDHYAAKTSLSSLQAENQDLNKTLGQANEEISLLKQRLAQETAEAARQMDLYSKLTQEKSDLKHVLEVRERDVCHLKETVERLQSPD